MTRATVLAALALCLAVGFVSASSPAPLSLWGSGSFLAGGSSEKAVSAVAALEELFMGVAGSKGAKTVALEGLLDAAKLADERPDAVVVVASAGSPVHQSAAAVQEALGELAGGAPTSLHLPNAEHAGTTHPVFAALRRSARELRLRVLGDCGGSYVPSSQPATADALRAVLAAPLPAGAPAHTRVVVMCLPPPPAGGDDAAAAAAEAALLRDAAQVLAAAAPERHLLVHTQRPANSAEEAAAARRLLTVGSQSEEAVLVGKKDRANQTGNYTTCDPTCQKHVMWLEGLIVLIVILLALGVGTCCMHMVDVPSRFAQPQVTRPHGD